MSTGKNANNSTRAIAARLPHSLADRFQAMRTTIKGDANPRWKMGEAALWETVLGQLEAQLRERLGHEWWACYQAEVEEQRRKRSREGA